MAYSSKIKNRTFFLRKIRFIAVRFILFSATLTAVVLTLRASNYTNMLSGSIIIAAAAIFLFYVFKLYLLFDRTWDGVILEKRMQYNTFAKKSQNSMDGSDPIIGYIYVKRSDGKIKKQTVSEDDLSAIEYFRTGDRVRHHAMMKLFEKEDKSRDLGVLCCGCLGITSKIKYSCEVCGLPLLIDDDEIEAARTIYYASENNDSEYEDGEDYEDDTN